MEEDTGRFIAGDGGAEEPEGMNKLVVAGEVWEVAQGVEDCREGLIVGGCCVAVGIGELGVDRDGASDHVEEPPDAQKPEGGWGEVDTQVEQEGDGDEEDHHHGVHQELRVALAQGEEGANDHVEDDKGNEERGWICSVLLGVHVLSLSE